VHNWKLNNNWEAILAVCLRRFSGGSMETEQEIFEYRQAIGVIIVYYVPKLLFPFIFLLECSFLILKIKNGPNWPNSFLTKIAPSEMFYDEIRLTKLTHS
jgi:hypothetical protein